MSDVTKKSVLQHPYVIVGVAIAVTLLGLGWAWTSYRSAREAAFRLQADRLDVEKWAGEMVRSASQPRVASLEVEPPERTTERIRKALVAASIDMSQLRSVDPQAPVRVARTSYQIRATQILVERVTMTEIVEFIAGLRDFESGMLVRDLDLSPVRKSQVSQGDRAALELWDARLVLTQMIFSPISEL